MNDKIEILKKFFTISVAAFEMQHTISKAFGYKGNVSYMHLLHLHAEKEINKEKPDLQTIDDYLSIMEKEATKKTKP